MLPIDIAGINGNYKMVMQFLNFIKEKKIKINPKDKKSGNPESRKLHISELERIEEELQHDKNDAQPNMLALLMKGAVKVAKDAAI